MPACRRYLENLKRAFLVNGGEGGATKLAWTGHVISLPWKVIGALLPPARFGGGWPCFVLAITLIGGITFLIDEVTVTGFGRGDAHPVPTDALLWSKTSPMKMIWTRFDGSALPPLYSKAAPQDVCPDTATNRGKGDTSTGATRPVNRMCRSTTFE